jgi:hypothetical protein
MSVADKSVQTEAKAVGAAANNPKSKTSQSRLFFNPDTFFAVIRSAFRPT